VSNHIVLLGDSIFDNKSYTQGAPDVVSHLATLLPASWQSTLLAIDGTTTTDVSPQFARVPADASHVVMSLGGNDAILNSDLLNLPLTSSSEMLLVCGERIARFERDYRCAIETLIRLNRDTTVCTIYNGDLHPSEAKAARIALSLFNDVILRVAVEHALKVIDLRFICASPSDYANAIEPSGTGGHKIATAIARAVGAIAGPAFSRVYGS
jgi:hypothetical protein